jgi:hypothetical protein
MVALGLHHCSGRSGRYSDRPFQDRGEHELMDAHHGTLWGTVRRDTHHAPTLPSMRVERLLQLFAELARTAARVLYLQHQILVHHDPDPRLPLPRLLLVGVLPSRFHANSFMSPPTLRLGTTGPDDPRDLAW